MRHRPSDPATAVEDAICIINIGPRERRRRHTLGLVALVAGVALVLGAWALGLPPAARLAAAPLFFGGFTGIFQARAKT